MLLITSFSAFSVALADDTSGHWAQRFISELYTDGVINGYPDGNFRPDSTINVDEFLKMVLKALGYDTANSQGYWAGDIIKKAEELEIVDSDDFFCFSRPITRGETAVILANALKLDTSGTADVSILKQIPDYYDILNKYKPSVLVCYQNKLLTGYDDGSFMQNRLSSRAEACVVITRMLKIKPLPNDPNKGGDITALNAYYVALTGKDTNSGTIDSPFATIERARDEIRSIKEAGKFPKEGITVYLRDGTYYIDKTIEFNASDSGIDGGKVVYRSYENETARLTGGISLPYEKFRKISADMSNKLLSRDAKNNVLELNLSELGITDLGELSRRGFLISANVPVQAELYINNKRQQLSRWPDSEWVGTTGIVRSGTRSQSGVKEGAVFTIDYDEPLKWKTNINEIYTSGVLGENYFYGYFPIEKIEKGQITLKEGAVKEYYSKHFIRYENIFEEISQPGEYYIDRTTGMLYLYPTSDFTKDADIRLSMLKDRIVSLSGAENITFSNIRFDTVRGEGIRGTDAKNIEVSNCDIFGTGSNGVIMRGTNNTIKNCHVFDIGATGIQVGGGDYDNLTDNGNVIENNHVHKVSQIERSYTSGITLDYLSVGTHVLHNEIHDTPHTAMIVYGPNHLVEYNEIYDAVKEFMDMDSIYMNVYQYPWERGVVYRRNYFHDFGNEMFTQKQINVAAIRTDNNGNGVNVIENVFYNIGYDNSNQVRSVCAEGIDNVIKNNIFIDVAETYDGPDGYSADAVWDLTNASVASIYKNFQKYEPVYAKKYPEISDFFKNHWKAKKKSNVFEGNLIASISRQLSTLNAIPDAQGFRADPNLVSAQDNLIVKKDPGFKDYKNKDFTLLDTSEAYAKIPNFPKIDFENIGLMKDTQVGTN